MKVLDIERRSECWIFRLNRPEKRNALSALLIEALLEGLDAVEASEVPLLVFQGVGKNFSAGFDFTGYEQSTDGDLLLRFVRIEMLLQRIAALKCMTLGLAHGRNYGAGVDLLAVCRQRICAADSYFCMPGLNFGLVLGTRRFAQLVGSSAALTVLSQAKVFTATEARDMGFVNGVHEESEWDDLIGQASQLARHMGASTRGHFFDALNQSMPNADQDLGLLARSAARPGLKCRIKEYLESHRGVTK